MPKNIWLPGFIHTLAVRALVKPFANSVRKTPRSRSRLDRLIINVWRKI